MKNPFVVINFADKELLVIIGSNCRTVKFSDIDKKEDFFIELFRRYGEVNFASKYADMNKKDFLNLLDDLTQAIKKEETEEKKETILAYQEVNNGEPVEEKEEEYRYIMSNTEKRFELPDIGLMFSHKGESYEVALIGQDKIDKSEYMKVFLKNGMLVMATATMVKTTQSEYLANSRKSRRKPGGLDIVDREEIDMAVEGGPEKMDITAEEMAEVSSNSVSMSAEEMASIGDSGLEYDAFANTTGDASLDALMKSMKS
jgi:predicted HTH domain antitoxin